MPDYFIDTNRGNDSNAGTSKDAAWQTLEKFRATASAGGIAAGSNVLLESSSIFSETRYLRFGTGTSELFNGAASARTTIGKYDYSSQYSGKPRLSWVVTPTASDWVFDATFGLWYISPAVQYGNANQQWGGHPRVTINGRLCTVVRYQSSSFTRGPLPSTDYEAFSYEASQPGRLYVYSPAGINPSDYYGAGAIKAASSSQGIFAFNRCGSYITIRDIELFASGKLVSIFSDGTSLGDISNFTLHGISGIGVGVLAGFVATASSRLITGLEVSQCVVQDAAGYGFHLNGCFRDARISQNRHLRGNLARTDGGAVYIQGAASGLMERVLVSDNYYEGMAANSKGSESDGCAVYCEVRATGVTVAGNVVRDSYMAFQDNSGANNLWLSNLAANCDTLIKVSDADNLAQPGKTTRIINNTGLLRGNYWQTYGPTDAGIKLMKGPGVAAANYTYEVRNNLLVLDKADQTRANSAAVQDEAGTTLTQSNNAIYGWDKQRTRVGLTTELGLSGAITADPLLDANFRPLPGSPLIGAGTHLGYRRDFDGKQRPNPPSIGAFDVAKVKPA